LSADIKLTGKQVACLDGLAWLNDEVCGHPSFTSGSHPVEKPRRVRVGVGVGVWVRRWVAARVSGPRTTG